MRVPKKLRRLDRLGQQILNEGCLTEILHQAGQGVAGASISKLHTVQSAVYFAGDKLARSRHDIQRIRIEREHIF